LQNMANNIPDDAWKNTEENTLHAAAQPCRILFVCSGNTCRSPMAEALAKQLLDEVEARSAGIAASIGAPPSDHSITVMAELGIDISGYRSQPVTRELMEWADVVLTMTRSHKMILCRQVPGTSDKIFTLAEYSTWGEDIPDPYGLTEDAYRLCRDVIVQNLQSMQKRIIK